HLVDLVQWTLFPDIAVDWRSEIKVREARRWPTAISPRQFQDVTGETRADKLDCYCNTHVSYTIRGVPVKMDVLWNYETPAGNPAGRRREVRAGVVRRAACGWSRGGSAAKHRAAAEAVAGSGGARVRRGARHYRAGTISRRA